MPAMEASGRVAMCHMTSRPSAFPTNFLRSISREKVRDDSIILSYFSSHKTFVLVQNLWIVDTSV